MKTTRAQLEKDVEKLKEERMFLLLRLKELDDAHWKSTATIVDLTKDVEDLHHTKEELENKVLSLEEKLRFSESKNRFDNDMLLAAIKDKMEYTARERKYKLALWAAYVIVVAVIWLS